LAEVECHFSNVTFEVGAGVSSIADANVVLEVGEDVVGTGKKAFPEYNVIFE
jgi:imidazole glycerol phosphate synthase subunit HisF